MKACLKDLSNLDRLMKPCHVRDRGCMCVSVTLLLYDAIEKKTTNKLKDTHKQSSSFVTKNLFELYHLKSLSFSLFDRITLPQTRDKSRTTQRSIRIEFGKIPVVCHNGARY